MLSKADSEVSTADTTDCLHSDVGIWDSLYKASYNNLGLTAIPNDLALKGGRKVFGFTHRWSYLWFYLWSYLGSRLFEVFGLILDLASLKSLVLSSVLYLILPL